MQVTEAQSRRITELVSTLEARLARRPDDGPLDPPTVEALDVVYHALTFTRNPRGLALWRQALWQKQLADEARQAVTQMLEYLTEAVARGQTQAASEICNCLQTLVDLAAGNQAESDDGRAVGEPVAAGMQPRAASGG